MGLDHDDDSRALGLVDWDRDGDLDLWVSNRNGPRVRFLRNDIKQENRAFAIKLVGTTSNRDAIGARASLFVKGAAAPVAIKTLRAGEGYLSQSSKWLLFPLSQSQELDFVEVRWPGGNRERFAGPGLERRTVLLEGTATARAVDDPPTPEFEANPLVLPAPTDAARIIPHAQLPLPALEYLNFEGRSALVRPATNDSFVLLTLWATWCSPCLAELQELQANRDVLAQYGITVVPVNIEELEKEPNERAMLVNRFFKRHKLSLGGGLGTGDLVEILDGVQRTVIGRQKSLPIPSSFLLDSEGDLVALYKGRFDFHQMLADVEILGQSGAISRDAALPFPGRWYVHPFRVDLFALPEKLLEIGRAEVALSYLQRHLDVGLARQGTTRDGSGLDSDQIVSRDRSVGNLYHRAGNQLAQTKLYQKATDAFQAALVFVPDSYQIREKLALTHQVHGDLDKALVQLEALQRLKPGQVPILNSLAWILATSDADALRDAAKAIRYAEEACRITQNQSPETLDTLAAAFAAAGQFSLAIEKAELALLRGHDSGDETVLKAIEQRLEGYRKGQAYRSSSSEER